MTVAKKSTDFNKSFTFTLW